MSTTQTLKEKCRAQQEACNFMLQSTDYVLVHVDGRSFSKLIKNKFKKPFDPDFMEMMDKTAVYLCENVAGAKLAYVQSDEISLLLTKDRPESDIFFGGRLCKMQSIIASLATGEFNRQLMLYNIRHAEKEITAADCVGIINSTKLTQFDCKVWDVPNANDAFAWFLFRNIDCVRNSKQQTAQTWCSHKELMGLNTDEQIAYLEEKAGVVWNNLSDGEKYGRLITRSDEDHVVTLSNGETVEFTRSKFSVKPGINFTDIDSRNKFFEENPYFEK